jgi:hypothetical protein
LEVEDGAAVAAQHAVVFAVPICPPEHCRLSAPAV